MPDNPTATTLAVTLRELDNTVAALEASAAELLQANATIQSLHRRIETLSAELCTARANAVRSGR